MDNETGNDDKEIKNQEDEDVDVDADPHVNGNEIETEQLNENELEKEQEQEPTTTNKANIEEDINPLCNSDQDKDIGREKDKDKDQQDKQLNDNIDTTAKRNKSNNQQHQQQQSTNNEQGNKQKESNGTEIKKTDHDLLETLSNDSFEKKFTMLQEKLFNRPNRAILSEDRLNPYISTSKGSKGPTINPKLEEIFAMLEAKDFKREIRELNKRPDNIPETRKNKFAIKNIMNYSPPKEIRYLSQNQERRPNYNYNYTTSANNAAQVKTHNNAQMKFGDLFKSKIQTVFKGSVDRDRERDRDRNRKDKGYYGSSIVDAIDKSINSNSNASNALFIEKIVPRKRDLLYNKDFFKAELSSLNMKLFGNEAKKNKKGTNGNYTKNTFYI